MPQRDETKYRQNTILLCVVFVGLIAIVALVLPFVYDRDGDNKTSGVDPTESPVGSPTPPPAPTVSPAPTTPTVSPAPSAEFPSASPAPTSETTSQRLYQFIQEFLIPISGAEVFEDKSTPQFRAATYIADVDPFTSELTSVEQLEDRYAAITFYYATSGDDWTKCFLGDESCTEGQWLVGDVCTWYAVSCDDVGRVTGFLFGTYGSHLTFSCVLVYLVLTD